MSFNRELKIYKLCPEFRHRLRNKIGLAYYFGTDLPHDIDKAGRWLSYASMVGHPAAIYARQLFIMDINSSAEDWGKRINNSIVSCF